VRHTHTQMYAYTNVSVGHVVAQYEVATISRLHKSIGLFCGIKYHLQGSFAKETCSSKEPTNRSHPIAQYFVEKHAILYMYTCIHMCTTERIHAYTSISESHVVAQCFVEQHATLYCMYVYYTYYCTLGYRFLYVSRKNEEIALWPNTRVVKL